MYNEWPKHVINGQPRKLGRILFGQDSRVDTPPKKMLAEKEICPQLEPDNSAILFNDHPQRNLLLV